MKFIANHKIAGSKARRPEFNQKLQAVWCALPVADRIALMGHGEAYLTMPEQAKLARLIGTLGENQRREKSSNPKARKHGKTDSRSREA